MRLVRHSCFAIWSCSVISSRQSQTLNEWLTAHLFVERLAEHEAVLWQWFDTVAAEDAQAHARSLVLEQQTQAHLSELKTPADCASLRAEISARFCAETEAALEHAWQSILEARSPTEAQVLNILLLSRSLMSSSINSFTLSNFLNIRHWTSSLALNRARLRILSLRSHCFPRAFCITRPRCRGSHRM